jgi:hypothetical protein
VSTPKLKGRRELKNLEYSSNFDAKSRGSSLGKSKKALAVMQSPRVCELLSVGVFGVS